MMNPENMMSNADTVGTADDRLVFCTVALVRILSDCHATIGWVCITDTIWTLC